MKKSPVKIAAVIIFLILLIAFNATRRPGESESSSEFQRVVDLYERQAKAAFEEGRSASKVLIAIRTSGGAVPLNMAFDNVSAEQNRDKTEEAIHLLNLIYESKIITKGGAIAGDYLVHIEVNNQVFEGAFQRSDIAGRMPLGIFLKLMQLKATS